jgi:hypothetical protein
MQRPTSIAQLVRKHAKFLDQGGSRSEAKFFGNDARKVAKALGVSVDSLIQQL